MVERAAVAESPSLVKEVQQEVARDKREQGKDWHTDFQEKYTEIKTRLEEIHLTLNHSAEILATMKADIDQTELLGQDSDEEREQLVEYMSEIDRAKAEQKRLEAQLEALRAPKEQAVFERALTDAKVGQPSEQLGSRLDEVSLPELGMLYGKAVARNDPETATIVRGELAKHATEINAEPQEVYHETLQSLGVARDKAVQDKNDTEVERLEGAMSRLYEKLDVEPATTAEAADAAAQAETQENKRHDALIKERAAEGKAQLDADKEVVRSLHEYGQPGVPERDPVQEATLELGLIEMDRQMHQRGLDERRGRIERAKAKGSDESVLAKLRAELAEYEGYIDQGSQAAERLAQYEDLMAAYRKRRETPERLAGIQKVIDHYRGIDAAYRERQAKTVIAEQLHQASPDVAAMATERAERVAEKPALSLRERANQFVRLATRINWEMDKAGGVTPKVEALRAERLRLAREQRAALVQERDAELASNPSADVEANNENIQAWDESIASLEAAAYGAPEAAQDRSPEAKLRERAGYYGSLQRSEKYALEDSGGEVTPEVAAIRAEMLQVATVQRDELIELNMRSPSPQLVETIADWSALISNLEKNS